MARNQRPRDSCSETLAHARRKLAPTGPPKLPKSSVAATNQPLKLVGYEKSRLGRQFTEAHNLL